MRKWKTAFIPALTVVAACAQPSQQKPTDFPPAQRDAQEALTEADHGKTLTLAVNAAVDVVLAGNPTTGYTWEVGAIDEAVVRLVGEPDYKPASQDDKVVGTGGVFTFRFQAVASGETDVFLIYRRPWETDVEPIRKFEVHVVVTP